MNWFKNFFKRPDVNEDYGSHNLSKPEPVRKDWEKEPRTEEELEKAFDDIIAKFRDEGHYTIDFFTPTTITGFGVPGLEQSLALSKMSDGKGGCVDIFVKRLHSGKLQVSTNHIPAWDMRGRDTKKLVKVDFNPKRLTVNMAIDLIEYVLENHTTVKLSVKGLLEQNGFTTLSGFYRKGDIVVRPGSYSATIYRRVKNEVDHHIETSDTGLGLGHSRQWRNSFCISYWEGVKDLGNLHEWEQCEDPRTFWIEEFAATEALANKQRFDEMVAHINEVLELHKRRNDASTKYGAMMIAPIKNFNTYKVFCDTIGLNIIYKDWEIENHLRNIGLYQPE